MVHITIIRPPGSFSITGTCCTFQFYLLTSRTLSSLKFTSIPPAASLAPSKPIPLYPPLSLPLPLCLCFYHSQVLLADCVQGMSLSALDIPGASICSTLIAIPKSFLLNTSQRGHALRLYNSKKHLTTIA